MAKIYGKNSKPGSDSKGFTVTPVSSDSSSFSTSPKKYTPAKRPPARFSWEVFGGIFLLLLIVGLPLCICVWDIGAPIKGYHD